MIPALENMMPDLINTVISPFTDLIGDWLWAVVLVVIVGGVYIKTESYGPPMAVMMVFSVLLTPVIRDNQQVAIVLRLLDLHTQPGQLTVNLRIAAVGETEVSIRHKPNPDIPDRKERRF